MVENTGHFAPWRNPRLRRTAVALGIGLFSFALMASRPPAETLYTVRILDGDASVRLLSEPMSVQKRFLESRIRVSRFDRVTPSLTSIIDHDVTIQISRGDRMASPEAATAQKLIFSKRIPAGRQIKIISGRNGERDICLVGAAAGKKISKQKMFHLTATAYSPDPRDCWPYKDGITAIGLKAGYGVVAVDPRVISLGTRVYVEGYGFAVAADLGGAIRGRKIDLCFDTHQEAKEYGRRPVKVYLLD